MDPIDLGRSKAQEPEGVTLTPCTRCGGDVVQKSRSQLAVVGVLMLAGPGLGLLWAPLWLPTAVLVPAGSYLLAWASVGRGLWCRSHKGFDGI